MAAAEAVAADSDSVVNEDFGAVDADLLVVDTMVADEVLEATQVTLAAALDIDPAAGYFNRTHWLFKRKHGTSGSYSRTPGGKAAGTHTAGRQSATGRTGQEYRNE